ncbi:Fanconi anemia group F protein [Boleophthalmus pectinirostris]|uniref:Fanconi anemia group F protein n=1 Tax=Boleophthalmus pectinirostris TaxID=150288 RepID=UPI000A1C4DEC|nr:Fanconi anemia group F protein [Boleophthalmus pectinirostris]
MEAMVRNLSSTMELLAVATHSDAVARWDEETLSRALHWALYCQHIHSRFHHSPAIRKVMERQLEMTNQSLRSVFPNYTALCFSDLSRCQNLLLEGLLRNTHVPVAIMKILFDKSTHLNNNGNSYQDVTGICSRIIESKSACKILGNVNIPSTTGADAEVQSELLLEKLNAVVTQSDGHRANQFLDSVLGEYENAQEHFCGVICAALQNESRMDLEFMIILDWLELKHNFLEYMCHSLPSSLLTNIAKKHLRFRDLYCDVLKKWAKEMEYDINNGEWIPVSKNPSVSFQNLTEHFVSLFKGSVSLKDHLETELKALKFTDGDFDVRGLSIWGDLLSEILK